MSAPLKGHFSQVIFVALEEESRNAITTSVTIPTVSVTPTEGDYAAAKDAAAWKLREQCPIIRQVERARTIYLGFMTPEEAARAKPPQFAGVRHSTDARYGPNSQPSAIPGAVATAITGLFCVGLLFGLPLYGVWKSCKNSETRQIAEETRIFSSALSVAFTDGRIDIITQTPFYHKGDLKTPGVIALNPAEPEKSKLITLNALSDGIYLKKGTIIKVTDSRPVAELQKKMTLRMEKDQIPEFSAIE